MRWKRDKAIHTHTSRTTCECDICNFTFCFAHVSMCKFFKFEFTFQRIKNSLSRKNENTQNSNVAVSVEGTREKKHITDIIELTLAVTAQCGRQTYIEERTHQRTTEWKRENEWETTTKKWWRWTFFLCVTLFTQLVILQIQIGRGWVIIMLCLSRNFSSGGFVGYTQSENDPYSWIIHTNGKQTWLELVCTVKWSVTFENVCMCLCMHAQTNAWMCVHVY